MLPEEHEGGDAIKIELSQMGGEYDPRHASSTVLENANHKELGLQTSTGMAT